MDFRPIGFYLFLSTALLLPRAGHSAPSADYSQAVSLFDAKNYQAALPLFQQVIQDEPKNASAYYYLGSCQETVGYLRGEVLNYYISNKLSPDAGMKSYADKQWEKLSPEDQDWVQKQFLAWQMPQPNVPLDVQTQAPLAAPAGKLRFGLRTSATMAIYNLEDFQSEISDINYIVQGYEAANPNDGYKLQTSVPSIDAALELNPYLTLGPDGELGASFVYWLPTSVSYNLTATAFPQYFVHSEWDLNSFECLLKGRIYFPTASISKGYRFFLEPAAGFQSFSIHWTENFQDTAGTPSSNQLGWDSGNLALDASLKLGAAFNLSPDSLFTFSVGYQMASASNFTGTFKDNGVPALNGVHGSIQMYSSPVSGQRYILFVPDDPNQLSNFGENSSTLNYCKPLTVDESGFRVTVDVSRAF